MYGADNPLHRARVQRGIGLSRLAALTMLSPRIVERIDEGRFAELPGGLYARSYIRAFASVVGVDPDHVVRELADRLPPAEDPFVTLREIARSSDPAWMISLHDFARSVRNWVAAQLEGRTAMTRRTMAATMDALVLLIFQAFLIQVTAWTCGVHPRTLLEVGSGPLSVVWGILVMVYFAMRNAVKLDIDGVGRLATLEMTFTSCREGHTAHDTCG